MLLEFLAWNSPTLNFSRITVTVTFINKTIIIIIVIMIIMIVITIIITIMIKMIVII